MATCMDEERKQIYFRHDNFDGGWMKEENVKKLYDVDDDPARKHFLDGFFKFRKEKGIYNRMPIIARKPLDLYYLYCVVQKYGGYEQSMKNRMWSQIAREMDLPKSMTSGAFTLKLKYIRLLYEYECHKRNKKPDESVIQSAKRLDDRKHDNLYAELQELRNRSAKDNFPYSNRKAQYGRETDDRPYAKMKDDMRIRKGERYHRVNSEQSYFTKRLSKPDYLWCSLEPREHKAHRHYSEMGNSDIPAIEDMRIDFMEIQRDKIKISLSLNNDRFSGELLCCG